MKPAPAKILVVDDEKSIHLCLECILDDCQIVSAFGIEEAKKIYTQHTDWVAIISDYLMLDGTGPIYWPGSGSGMRPLF